MDLKTLEYMEERAGKARKIVNRIEQLTNNINLIKCSNRTIDLYVDSRTIRLETGPRGKVSENSYGTQALAAIQNTFIDMTNAEIKHLKKQLEEL